jgi:hypothetical protein
MNHDSLPWVAWNKMTQLVPVKKTTNSCMGKFTRDSLQLKDYGLPKLSGVRLTGTLSVTRSPKRQGAHSRFTKTFSPVLNRGRFSKLSSQDNN